MYHKRLLYMPQVELGHVLLGERAKHGACVVSTVPLQWEQAGHLDSVGAQQYELSSIPASLDTANARQISAASILLLDDACNGHYLLAEGQPERHSIEMLP